MSDYLDERGPQYREDDRLDVGYCPTCGQECVNVSREASGWCPDHGKVFVDFEPPAEVLIEDEEEEHVDSPR